MFCQLGQPLVLLSIRLSTLPPMTSNMRCPERGPSIRDDEPTEEMVGGVGGGAIGKWWFVWFRGRKKLNLLWTRFCSWQLRRGPQLQSSHIMDSPAVANPTQPAIFQPGGSTSASQLLIDKLGPCAWLSVCFGIHKRTDHCLYGPSGPFPKAAVN